MKFLKGELESIGAIISPSETRTMKMEVNEGNWQKFLRAQYKMETTKFCLHRSIVSKVDVAEIQGVTIAFRIWVYDLTLKSKLGEDWLHARKRLISRKKWSDPMSQRVDVVGNKKLEQWFSAVAHIKILMLWSHHRDFKTLMCDF